MTLRVSKSVRSIVVLRPDSSGRMVSTTLHEREKSKRKSTRWLRPIEKSFLSACKGEEAFADAYLARHERSNGKKKDGWVRDLPYNVLKADKKRRKKWRVMDNVVRVFL